MKIKFKCVKSYDSRNGNYYVTDQIINLDEYLKLPTLEEYNWIDVTL